MRVHHGSGRTIFTFAGSVAELRRRLRALARWDGLGRWWSCCGPN